MIFLQLSDDGKRRFDARVPERIIAPGTVVRLSTAFAEEAVVRSLGARFAPASG